MKSFVAEDSPDVCVHCGRPIGKQNVWRYSRAGVFAHLACVSQINHDKMDKSIYERIQDQYAKR